MADTTHSTGKKIAAFLLVAVLAAGCGETGDDEASDTKEKPTRTTEQSEENPDQTTTTEAAPKDAGSGSGQLLSKSGASSALEGDWGAVLRQAFGFPESIATMEGQLLRVSAAYSGPGTTERYQSETYTIDTIQQKPLAEVSVQLREHFSQSGFTFTPRSTEDDMTGTLGPADHLSEWVLGITLEEVDNGTKAEMLLSHTTPEGAEAEVDGELFGFVQTLRFDEAMAFANANVALDSGRDDDFGDLDPYASFSAMYELPADGYESGKAALARLCAGGIEGFSCPDGGVEPTIADDGVMVREITTPDQLSFDVTMFKAGAAGGDVPVMMFNFVGDF